MSTPIRHLAPEEERAKERDVPFTIIDRQGIRHKVVGKTGDNLMYLAHHLQSTNPSIIIEGACEASLACSTCHVMLSEEHYDVLEEPGEDEDDMLDQAPCLTSTSRLGCQIILTPELTGMEVTLPSHTRNFYIDGHVPTPH